MENTVLQEIRDCISQGEYVEARGRMDALKGGKCAYSDRMAILDASIYEAMGDRDNMFQAIRVGLQHSYDNYELYYMLGYYYLPDCVNQAYLCFQNALLYCNQETDAEMIMADMVKLANTGQVTVRNTAIVIVSYNACYMMQKNIESIRNTLLPGTYRIIVVDNASDDGIREWLREQQDIILLENGQNVGFAPACNQAVRALRETVPEQEDIFLLNNDTRLAHNSLFWLRMGLYSDERVGAAGSMSNYAGNQQQLDITFALPGDYLDYGAKRNIPDKLFWEERVRLSGFAMLIKGHVWDETGGMDETFAPGYFEDDDLSMRIQKVGYRLLLCHNSFVYHAGSQSFSKYPGADEVLVSHYQVFVQKYGFDILQYAYSDLSEKMRISFALGDAFNLLQIGSGLGADLKYIRSVFPAVNAVGVESDAALYDVASRTEMVFRDVTSLYETFQRPVFHVLLLYEQEHCRLSKAEREMLKQLCLAGCVVLPRTESPDAAVDSVFFDQIKLVIWDLDQTFWTGILSEGEVSAWQDQVELVRDLTDRGIINSISSKNSETEVSRILVSLGIADYFVFNHINWENKGEQIRQKLSNMNLRPENVLFIDDDIRNLEEARYCNPGLMTAHPDVIPALREYVSGLPCTDLQHKRLQNYKILEKRCEKEKSFLNREEFLYYSDITLEIHSDCAEELDRITELVARTNQLNFTKVRDDRNTLRALLEDRAVRNGYVKVRDKFGDYGIVGFYCFNRDNNKLRHFLFSCRVIGMGIAECVYNLLQSPTIEIVPPVVVRLGDMAHTPWIHVSFAQTDSAVDTMGKAAGKQNKIKILLKGPCDMSTLESYLSGGDITTEFNYVNDQGFITTGQNHSMHIWQSAMLSKEKIEDIIAEVPFIVSGDFETSIFKDEYHVICYSLLPDCHAGLYRNKNTGAYISFGSRNFDLTAIENAQGYIDGSIVNHAFPFTGEIIAKFVQNWEFVGVTSGEDLIRNLDYMYTHVSGSPLFILLLGSEIEYEGINEEFANHAEHHREVNALVKSYARSKDRIRIIEMTDYIHSQEDYDDSINHFSRNVYYQLATALCACINEQVEVLKSKKERAEPGEKVGLS